MVATEQEKFDERSQKDQTSTPKPDPTALTSEALKDAIGSLRTLIDQRIGGTEELFDSKIQLGREVGLWLKELMAVQFSDLKELLTETEKHREELLHEKFEGRDKALVAALQAAKEAVDKANDATEKRFDNVTELLGNLNTALAVLLPRAEAESRIGDLDRRIGEVKSIVDTGFAGAGGLRSGGREVWAYIVGALGLLAMVLTAVFNFWRASGH